MKKLNVTLKVGDTVTATLFGGQIVTGKVKDIEVCAPDSKYGTEVDSCNIDTCANGVVDLDCGHWCYFNQIKHIERSNS